MKQANSKKRARPTSPITGVDGSDRAREEEELPAAEDGLSSGLRVWRKAVCSQWCDFSP